MIILCNRRKKYCRRTNNTDHRVKQSLHVSNPQQRTHDTSHQSQHDHTDGAALQLGAKVKPKSKLETVNAMYISTEVRSLNSLIEHHDTITSRTDVIGCGVIITPNPSYAVGPNSSETGKECEYQYDYVQTDDGSVQHDKVVGATTSGGKSLILLTMLTLILTHPMYCHQLIIKMLSLILTHPIHYYKMLN